MKTFEIDVTARLTGGIAPTISYMHGDTDVTDAIRAIRFHYDDPASFIEDYAKFQSMLYKKNSAPSTNYMKELALNQKTCRQGDKFYGAFLFFY